MRNDPGQGTVPDAELHAAAFAGVLWTAVDVTGGPRPAVRQHWHFPAAFDPGWLETLPLPIGERRPQKQPVALLDDRDQFGRHTNGRELRKAYASRPRTRVYESINWDGGGAWYSLVACHLGRLAHSRLQVVCSVFESRHGDESLGAHGDAWYAAIVHMAGAKTWRIGDSLLAGSREPAAEVVTRAGDILLMPKGLPHSASTPPDPGQSVHLSFALDRDSQPQARDAVTGSGNGTHTARWVVREREEVFITDTAGREVSRYPIPPGGRPARVLLDNDWSACPGSEWREELPGQWRLAVFHRGQPQEGQQ
jgi:Cupin superfamily protein